MKIKNIILFILVCINSAYSQTNIITSGSTWKYLDNGTNQGTAWYGTSYNDAAWLSGAAELGYGDGDEATIVSYGADANNKYITTYFRKTISIADASIFSNYSLNVRRDDGVVVYINGTEVYRNNLPTGTITNTTLATNASDNGTVWQTSTLASSTLVTGTNVIAVEIHQGSITSSDVSFDLYLVGNLSSPTASLTRGPYLQTGTSSSIIIKWRTDVPTNSKVNYGIASTSLTSTTSDAGLVTDHEIKLTGLNSNTRYYYSIGSSSQTLQGNADNTFLTSPANGETKKTNIWVTGDCGSNTINQTNVRNSYESYMGTNHTDVWLLLGDNAYNSGYDNEYQTAFFDYYPNMLKKTVLWPSPGNHDYANNATRQDDHAVPYYDIFSLPKNAEAGGVASTKEEYYSYDYSNIHFISLDSYGEESNLYRLYDTLSPQVVWLKQDLAANTKKWTIVYWHHPPYTMGSHNSDTEAELVSMRENFIRILERYKVDLILCGHSHSYERSKLMKNHYGNEASFNAITHHLSSSSGKYDGTTNSCPYIKNSANSHNGTVYVVAGSAGKIGGSQASFPHSAMYYSNTTQGGSLALTIEENKLDAKFICYDGIIRDQFTIEKDVNKTTTLNLSSGDVATLTASWIGSYSWTNGGETTRSKTITATTSTTITVTDPLNCLSDIYNITVTDVSTFDTGNNDLFKNKKLSLSVFQNPLNEESVIKYNVPFEQKIKLTLLSIDGIKIKELVSENIIIGEYTIKLNCKTENLKPGIYLLKLEGTETAVTKKVIVPNE